MSLKIIVKKLHLLDEKIITSSLIKNYCRDLNLEYYNVIRYLTANRYLYRILKGIFYKPDIEERKFGKIKIDHLRIIADALRIKGVKNWYFGLETAVKLNNITHEYFAIDSIINDKIFRANPINILGYRIKFIKFKKKLFKFGIKKDKARFSDPEKTVVDMIYIARYSGLNEEEIINKINDLIKCCSVKKLRNYSKKYNKSVCDFVKRITCKKS